MNQIDRDRRVDYVEFGSTDIAATKHFYTTVFGWTFTDYGPEYTSFDDGRLTGGFHKVETIGAGGALIVIYAAELERVEAAIRAQECEIVKEIFSFPGGRRFHFADPSGNELAVWSDS